MANIVAFIVCLSAAVVCVLNGHPGLAMIDCVLAGLNLIIFMSTR